MPSCYIISKPQKGIKCSVQLPASKSISNRALIIRALSKDKIRIINLSDAKDTQVLQNLLAKGGRVFDAGDSGTAMRFMTAYLAVSRQTKILTGSERMKQRPISILVNALRRLGANIDYPEKDGFPPLEIKTAGLVSKDLEIDGSISSQYISALLMIAPALPGGLRITLNNNIASKPYIAMTLALMRHFGTTTSWKDRYIKVEPGKYKPEEIVVEPDWSSASYWYSIAALADDADIFIRGLKKESLQGDAVTARIFEHFGVTTRYSKDGVNLLKDGAITKPFNYDFKDCPDLAQTVAVVCTVLGIPCVLSGLQNLKIKETDRIQALIRELAKTGAGAEEIYSGTIAISPPLKHIPEAIEINTHNDHRMAMAFAPIALRSGKLIINHPSVVNKSYPNYWKELKKAGFSVKDMTITNET